MFEELNQIAKNLKKPTATDVNIFKVLGIHRKEVLVCRMIRFLLMPNAYANVRTESLKLFLSLLTTKSYSESALCGADIVLEEAIEDDRRVDIVIYIAGDVFPIEVKIGAKDQPSQLFDYYHHFKHKHPHFSTIWYLTPGRHQPSVASITSNDFTDKLDLENDVCCLSFEQLLNGWLSHLKTDHQEYGMLINQFKDVITDMIYENHNEQEFYRALTLTGEEPFRIEGNVETALALMALDQRELWRNIRDRYLKKCLTFDTKEYYLAEDNGDDIDDRFCLYAVVHNDSRQKVAWICVDTNLYIVCRQQIADLKGSDHYYWQYLNPKNNAQPFPLIKVNATISDNDRIDIGKYLNADIIP